MQGKILFCKKRFGKAAGIRIADKDQPIRSSFDKIRMTKQKKYFETTNFNFHTSVFPK